MELFSHIPLWAAVPAIAALAAAGAVLWYCALRVARGGAR